MIITMSTYFALALILTLALSYMIMKIGTLLGNCPASGQAARAAAVTIATGYCAIGFGGVILVGALFVGSNTIGLAGLFGALGFVSLCLGLGFTHAIGTLRAVVAQAVPPTQMNAIPA